MIKTKKHLLLTTLLASTVMIANSAFATQTTTTTAPAKKQFKATPKADKPRQINFKGTETGAQQETAIGVNEISRQFQKRTKQSGENNATITSDTKKELLKHVARHIEDFKELQQLTIGGVTLKELKGQNITQTARDIKIDAALNDNTPGSQEALASFEAFFDKRAQNDEHLEGLIDNFDFAGSLKKREKDTTKLAALTEINTIENPDPNDPTKKTVTSDLAGDANGDKRRKRKAEYQKLIDINGIKGPNRSAKHYLLRDEIDAIKNGEGDPDTRLKTLQDNFELFMVKSPENKNVSELPDFQRPDADASAAIEGTHHVISADIDNRIASLSSAGAEIALDNNAGVAAGDLFASYGGWIKGTISYSTQKAHGFVTGYTSDQKGVTIGFDTGDESMVGVSYSFFNNKVKNKTDSTKKDDISSHTGTIYGKFSASKELFFNGQVQYGASEIKKKRTDATGGELTAKPKATTVAGKVEVGYDYVVPDNYNPYTSYGSSGKLRIIPTIGLAYSDTEVKGYNETGSTGPLPSIGKSTSRRTSIVTRLSSEYAINTDSLIVVPEAHIDLDYTVSSKESGTSVSIIDGIAPIVTPSEKPEKFRYSVGFSLKMQPTSSNMYEFSAGYDLGLAKKFISHTGSLKVRVNF